MILWAWYMSAAHHHLDLDFPDQCLVSPPQLFRVYIQRNCVVIVATHMEELDLVTC